MQEQPKEGKQEEKKIDVLDLPACPPLFFEAGKMPNQLQSIRENIDVMWQHLWITAKQVKGMQKIMNDLQTVYANALTLILNTLGKQNLIHQNDKGLWQEGGKPNV